MNQTEPQKIRSFPAAWREAAVFGALWGAGEITLGAFLTATRIPLSGVFMACLGIILLTSSQMLIRRDWFALRTALVCAGLRSLSPGGIIFGPMFAIILQGLLISVAFKVFRKSSLAGMLAGFIITISSVLQGFIVKLIFYGAPLIEIYVNLLGKIESIFHLRTGSSWTAVFLFFFLIGFAGSVAGFVGWRIGLAALARLGNTHEA